MKLAVVIVGVCTVLSSSANATPRLVFDRRTDCPTAVALKAALRTHAKDARGTLHVRPIGKTRIAIRYAATPEQPEQRRTLDVSGSCESVPDAIALLVDSWSRIKLAEVTERRVRATPRAQPTATGPTEAPPPVAPPEPDPVPPVQESPVEPPKIEPPSAVAPPPPPVESPIPPAPPFRRFAVLLIGSGSSLYGGSTGLHPFVAGGALRFEFPVLGRFSGAAQMRLEQTRSDRVEEISATSQVSGLDLLARYQFHDPARTGLGLNAGLGLQRITAFADGQIEASGVQTRYAPEFVATLEWNQTLVDGLFLRVVLGAEVRASTQEFGFDSGDGFAPLQVLPPFGPRAGLGLGWAF